MGIAVEPFNADTGGMQIIPGSHRAKKDYGIEQVAVDMGVDQPNVPPSQATLNEMLRRVGADPTKLMTLEMNPGDVGVWSPYIIHGGGLNTAADGFRSFYIQGFATAQKCDRGHIAWLDGVPQPLGEPVLIQLDNFRETLAEGGKYYHFTGDWSKSLKEEEHLEAARMNVVRD